MNEALRAINDVAAVRVVAQPRVITGHGWTTSFPETDPASPEEFTARLEVQPRFAHFSGFALDIRLIIRLMAGSTERREKRLDETVPDGGTAFVAMPLREGEQLRRHLPLVSGSSLFGLAKPTAPRPTTLVAFITPRLVRAIEDDCDDRSPPPPP